MEVNKLTEADIAAGIKEQHNEGRGIPEFANAVAGRPNNNEGRKRVKERLKQYTGLVSKKRI